MARDFFKNLPNTTTPLTAPRMNALLDGDEAMGNIVVDSVRSKNLLSFENWENTSNNIICKSENGKITITGTFGSQTNFYRSCNLDLKAGTTYVISKNQSNQGFYPYFILRNGETQVVRIANDDGYITYTPEADIHIDTIMFYLNGASGVNCTLYPQVEIGTTPTDYAPYQNLSGLEIYTDGETVVGKWINGKPIYRQVFIRNNANNFNGVAPYNDEIIKMQCLVKRSGQNSWRNLPWLFANDSSYGNSSWAGGFYFIDYEIKFQGGTDLLNINKLILIIEYTKTTD